MFENLKQMAMQRLMAKMASNALGQAATQEAATEGASGIMDLLKSKVAGGQMDQVKDLFSGGGNMESNGVFQEAKGKLSEVLQAKGMSAEEAEVEAANTAPDLIAGMKEKFESQDEADSEFNLDGLANMLPGGLGDIVKNVTGGLKGGADGAAGGVGDLLGKAKDIFGK